MIPLPYIICVVVDYHLVYGYYVYCEVGVRLKPLGYVTLSSNDRSAHRNHIYNKFLFILFFIYISVPGASICIILVAINLQPLCV